MKISHLELDHKRSHIIDQLAKHGYTDTDDLTYRELVNKLAVARAMEIKSERPGQGWF